MNFLDHLNEQQRQAVTTGLGPVLVLAGPGSGKTRVLTQRIAYLIGHMGVRPYHILAVTFTNKAAREMEKRVGDLLGAQMRGLTLGTFHGACVRILRRESDHLPFDANFVIFDSDDQLSLVKRALKDLDIDDKHYRLHSVQGAISRAKNELILPEDFPIQTYRDEVIRRIYEKYQELLLISNAVDFDDLLLRTVHLLEQYPDVRQRYTRRYEHVLVDEFQDTNMAQYTLLKHLTSYHGNIFVVGDTDQCLPTGTIIQTPNGSKPIEEIVIGDQVVAASGRGASMPARVSHVESRRYGGELVQVVTRCGFTFSATPNHIVFSRLSLTSDVHYVYLVYRKDLGYRVGISMSARSNGIDQYRRIGLHTQSFKENADRMWILHVCKERDEAYYWEQFYAVQYGISTTVFHIKRRRVRMPQETSNRPYRNINTRERAECLLNDLNMDVRYPHFTTRHKLHRNAVNLCYFGDTRRTNQTPRNAHRVDVWNSGTDPAKRFGLMPASHLHPSMIVAVEHDRQIVEDEIVEVNRQTYRGKVYDLEVDELHNYVAGGMVVHNSIYRWRGADYQNVRRFEKDFPDSHTIWLEQNYRSKQMILDVAMAVIDRNPHRTPKQLFTERGGGNRITLYEAYDDRAEASFVVDTIASLVAQGDADPGDFAIMYRTNAQSRLLEEAFLQENLPYKLVGAQRFYGRREIKDIIAYLRTVHNPVDEASLLRVINVPPRRIGHKTLEVLRRRAVQVGMSPGDLLLDLSRGEESPHFDAFPGRSVVPLTYFGTYLAQWRVVYGEFSPLQLMDRILGDIDYQTYLDDGTEEGVSRWENVMELRRLATEYHDHGLLAFLEAVALVSDQDTLDDAANVPTLLTLHAAKGLEFPVVLIVGLEDGNLPHIRSFDDPEAMAEERRLLYVGITRAKDHLYLVNALNRTTYGYAEPANPSRFLDDIPTELLNGASSSRRGRKSTTSTDLFKWESPTPETAPAVQLQYAAGMRVRHPVWGEGIVLNSRVQDRDEIVDIFFENIGLKRVAASLAKLELIEN